MFNDIKDIRDYFEWTEELVSIEKNCLLLFLDSIFKKYKSKDSISIEELLKEEYFNAITYRELQVQYEKELEEENLNNGSNY